MRVILISFLSTLVVALFSIPAFSASNSEQSLLAPVFSVDDLSAQSAGEYYVDKTVLISRQIDMLKNRIARTQSDLQHLQAQQSFTLVTFPVKKISEKMLAQAALEVASAKSTADSVSIELAESKQAVTRYEKSVEALKNQMNVVNIFGLKSADLAKLGRELKDQTILLKLEKIRTENLLKLQTYTINVLQMYQATYDHLQSMARSEAVLQLKDRQTQLDLDFQKRQHIWLKRLDDLQARLSKMNKQSPAEDREILQAEIFNANEHINFIYLQLLIARYEDQIQQLSGTISPSSSIALLGETSTEVQGLSKQILQLSQLLTDRLSILKKYKDLPLIALKTSKNETIDKQLNQLIMQYETAQTTVTKLIKKITDLRVSLDKALQQAISARQGLPGFSIEAWIELGGEILLVPSLALKVFGSLGHSVSVAIMQTSLLMWLLLAFLEVFWIAGCLLVGAYLRRTISTLSDHTLGHVNAKWMVIRVLQRLLPDIAILGNLAWFFTLIGIPLHNYLILISLAFVWIFFRFILVLARLGLVETVHDSAGTDVRLYRHLRGFFIAGGIVTALMVFIHQLPVMYEVMDLADRLFLLFLLFVSIFLLRQWELLPNLILSHIDEKRIHSRRVIRMLGILIPSLLLINSLIGLSGYVNLVSTVSWYEGVFIFVLAAYLVFRGLLNDAMEKVSRLLIRHVTNGWLWTEAFLKPIDRVLRIALFLVAWAVLFLLYGWDSQSPVVERLNGMLHYPLLEILNTVITPLGVIELAITLSLLYWAARWTREFMYRLLLSHTRDLGLRNSLAILTQYAVIFIGIFIALAMLGIDFRALTAVATAFSLGVGLGLRDLVNNFVCGFLLLIERPLRIGDTICVGGYEGEVTHIGGRAVTVRTWDHMDVLVPNAEIFSKSFVNWTAKDNVVRTVIPIKIDYHEKPEEVQAIIYYALEHHKDVLSDPAPEVFIKELTDGKIEFEVRYFLNLKQVRSRPWLRSEILVAIWEAFEKHGIMPPVQHHEVLLQNPKRLSKA